MTQFLARIQQRENVLLFYVAPTGTVGGFALGGSTKTPEFLVVIPYLAGAAGLMMAYQTIFVDSLIQYFHDELGRRLPVLPFELSAAFRDRGMNAVKLRTIGNYVTLLIPVVFACVSTFAWAFGPPHVAPLRALLWSVGAVFGVIGPSIFHLSDWKHITVAKGRAAKVAASSGQGPSSSGGSP